MLTLVIPTMNRAPFLKRLLRYYMNVQCPFPILIGDSSNSEHLKETQKFLSDEVGSQLKVEHLVDPFANGSEAKGWQADLFMRGLMDHVKTPYVAFYADDDFAIVSNLQKAVDFLEANSDFSFVCGEAILFTLKTQGAIGEVEGTNYYQQAAFEQPTASDRLSSLFSHYVVLEYGVSRTEQKKRRWTHVFEAKVNNLAGEIINTGLVVIQGKVFKMDRLLLVRQGHPLQSSRITGGVYDWILKVYSTDFLIKLKDIFCGELMEVDPVLNEKEVRWIVKKCLWGFLVSHIHSKDDECSAKNRDLSRHLLGMIKRNDRLKGWGLYLYSLTSSGKMKLPALLRRSSPYHDDFLPVYKTITENRF